MIADRESVVNLHMGIPKANGLRDDVQLLWSGSALANYFYQNPNDMGPGNNQFISSLFGTKASPPVCGPEALAPGLTVNGCTSPPGAAQQIQSFLQPNQFFLQNFYGLPAGPYYCSPPNKYVGTLACGPTYLAYGDNVAYNVPFGSVVATPAGTKAPGVYMAPDTPAHAFNGAIPLSNNWVGVQPERHRYHEAPVHLRAKPVGLSARVRLHLLLRLDGVESGLRRARRCGIHAVGDRGAVPAHHPHLGWRFGLPGSDQRPKPGDGRRQLHDRRRHPLQ